MRQVAAAFSPADIAGLTVWLNPTGLAALNDGDSIASWSNSGNASIGDLAQPTAGQRPTCKHAQVNGLRVARFDGNDFLFVSSVLGSNLMSNEVDVFAVMKQTGTQANNTTIAWDHATSNRLVVHATYSDALYFDHPNLSGGRISVAQPAGWDNAWRLLNCWRAGNVRSIAVDGSVLTTGGDSSTPNLAATTGFYVGTDLNQTLLYIGDLAELLVYKQALSSTDRSAVKAYISSKYSLTIV
jgi:hypothetical protein